MSGLMTPWLFLNRHFTNYFAPNARSSVIGEIDC